MDLRILSVSSTKMILWKGLFVVQRLCIPSETPLHERLFGFFLTEGMRRSPSQRGWAVATFLLCAPRSCRHRPPGYSQHVGDDAHTPHVCWEGDKVIVHHFRSQELWSSKVNLQLLPRFVPVPDRDGRQCWERSTAQCCARQGTAEPAQQTRLGNQGSVRGFKKKSNG